MQFFHLDAQAQLHVAEQKLIIPQSIVDIDLDWLQLGHKVFPHRLHAMECFEKISTLIGEDHQFTFRRWYDSRHRSTHCIWYSIPKKLLKLLPNTPIQAKALIFVLPRYFPPSCRNKSVVCFVELPHCESIAGYIHGHCVCFKKLPLHKPLNVQQEWQYLQQTYPQWLFEHSLYLTHQPQAHNSLIQTHQHTLHMNADSNLLINRMSLYGINQPL